jgi:hypothetical protein
MITVICNIHNDVKDLLPHFLSHYVALKVDSFVFGVRNGIKNPVWNELNDILRSSGVAYKTTLSYEGDIDGELEATSLDNLRTTFLRNKEWYVPTDLDEFHTLPNGINSYPEFVDICNKSSIRSARGYMIDRIKSDGSIPMTIYPIIPIYEQFPKEVDITKLILEACNHKCILANNDCPVSMGHHKPYGNEYHVFSKTLHFKWFGDIWKKEQEKFEKYTNLGYSYASENKKLLNLLTQSNGKLLLPPLDSNKWPHYGLNENGLINDGI